MKEIKDYLHLYLGCECEALVKYSETSQKWVKGYLAGIVKGKPQAQLYDVFGNAWELLHETEEIKPILRPLSDTTEEEAIVYFGLPKGVEILKRQIIRGKYLSFEYRWVHENPKLNIEDGYCYSESAIGFDGTRIDNYPDKILYLLKQSFDLFGLIESGLAISKTQTQEQ